MSSSEDEDVFALLQVGNLNRRRRFWVHPYLQNCAEQSTFTRELRQYPDKFQKFYGMSKEAFYLLLENTRHSLQKTETNWRKPISAAERLLITLRYVFFFFIKLFYSHHHFLTGCVKNVFFFILTASVVVVNEKPRIRP